MKLFKKAITPLLLAAMLLCGSVTGASATEGGGGAYPNGAEDFMSGAVPPKGTYLINYFTWYSADRLNNNDGNNVAPPGFELNAVVDVVRILHVTDKKLLGADWGMHIFIPIVDVDAKVPPAGINENRGGLGDIIVDPIVLGWHLSKNLHMAAGLDIFIPTGNYNKNNLANPGRNYWTFEPIFGTTYLADNGFELSGKFMYDINTENNDTHYLSGNEFHVDYTVGQHIGPWAIGAGGYWYQQTTEDELHGNRISGSKGRAFSIGPQAKYDYKNMSFTIKYQIETETRNRPEGNNLWAKFMYAF
jgi:hypothetical protein